jgi:hypothetical protein
VAAEKGMNVEFIDPSFAVASAVLAKHNDRGTGKFTVIASKKSSVLARYIKKYIAVRVPIEIISPA